MEFNIRKADEKDTVSIMKIMEDAGRHMENPDWFVTDDEAYIRSCQGEKGFIMVAEETTSKEAAGFFVVKYPQKGENLGEYLDFDEKKLSQTAIMDSAAVLPKYRGHRLQARMEAAARAFIDRKKYRYLLCTIHPDNQYSLKNMQKQGYKIQKKVTCYGGLPRFILLKEVFSEKI